jgi:HK97 family phage major capsid protein
MAKSHASDAMISRLQTELEERNTHAQGIIRAAQDDERDLNDAEQQTLAGLRSRMGDLQTQLDTLDATAAIAVQTANRMRELDSAIRTARTPGTNGGVVEYRSAGAWIADYCAAQTGNKSAQERLEVFYRTADHQLTTDNPGVIPDPVVGGLINFIDSARPITSFLGPQTLEQGVFYRPRVTQHTEVARQTDGTTADVTEKVELASQKMLIDRLTVTAETYGGYVNVSRQNIDWSRPNIMDLIVNDLAAQYAIVTEEVVADALATTQTADVSYPLNPTADELAAAIWTAIGTVYSVTKNQGRVAIAVAPDRLGAFGPLFAPYAPQSQQGTGFMASNFGQGVMGSISGIPVIMSAALDSGEAFVFSTAAIEVWEQRIGSLQVVEPSVLGVQVAYAGYFATLIVNDDAIVPLDEATV